LFIGGTETAGPRLAGTGARLESRPAERIVYREHAEACGCDLCDRLGTFLGSRSRLSHVELAAGFQAEPCTGVKGAWRCP
jgi:hypothetical protein